PRRGVVHRVGALLDARSSILPRIMGRRCSQGEIRSGARERLSSPTHKGSLTTSSYSTDLSSDFSEFRRCALPSSRRNCAPPLVLPEMSDSDAEQSVFSEVALPEYEGRRSPNRGGRPMARRSQISSISENTSPSSASSRDHSENMTSSRSSFLELIGLRKKKERDECIKRDVPLTRAAIKKRKRKISESDSIQSSGENTQKIEKRIAPSTYNRAPISTQHESGEQPKKSLLQTPKQYRPMRHSHTSPRYFDESDEEESTDSCRPQLRTPFLEPHGIWNREQKHVLHDDNEVIRNELTMIRNRNARLIEQLREKSMEHSKLTAQMATLQKQLESLQNRCHLNAELERLSLTERLIAGPSTVMSAIEEKLRHFEEDLQIAKSEALRNQQAAINSSLREQSAYQACLEQVERLQRENFALLQLRASELAMQDKHIRQLLEMMPSYDALYSFTMGIVRKLSQMRTSFIDKAAHASRADLELLHTQSSLLITHAQIERMRLQLCASASRHPPRPVSYHGEDLFERMIKPKLNFLLPFKLHGQRVDKYRRSESTNMESEVEKNEQNIETEFLRLFDYARCLSSICEGELNDTDRERTPPTPQLLQSKNDQSAITTTGGLMLGERGQLLKNAANRTAIMQRDRRNAYNGRPVSLVETPERKINGATCMKRFAEEVIKRNERRDEPVSNLNLHRFANGGYVKAIVSSLQDVSNSLTRSPSSTPIMTRRIPSLVNCQKQTSLDRYSQLAFPHYHHPYEAHKYDCPPSRSSQSSDYAAVNIKQSNAGYANIEKKRTPTSKPSPLLSGSRLRMPNNCSPTALSFTRDSVAQVRRNTIGSNNSSTSLNAPDGRGDLQIRRNADQISVIREESPPSTSILPERRRLPKPMPSPTEKKKNTSWLSRLKPNKK
uniref:Uncharacterized protein n=2 Tax=Parascaris univalens TaxID=6257 RepID=A0A915B933_PARUN